MKWILSWALWKRHKASRFVLWLTTFLLVSFVDVRFSSAKVPSSFKTPNPLGWMHMLPGGEAPGWYAPTWFQVDVSQANIWNAPIQLMNMKTGDIYDYQADFGQTSGLIEIGGALTDFLSLSLEIPFTTRGGGILDQTIDEFHTIIGSDDFSRPHYPKMNTALWWPRTGKTITTNLHLVDWVNTN